MENMPRATHYGIWEIGNNTKLKQNPKKTRRRISRLQKAWVPRI